MTVIQVFADVLSYLRLYALGHCGAIVAATINDVAGSLPFVISVILILFSHLINIVLATMSGVIQDCDSILLNGITILLRVGGKAFKPLKLIKKDKPKLN